MPRKKRPKRKVQEKPKPRKEKDTFEQRFGHISEEMETIGKRIEERINIKESEWNSWFHRTFGIAGPFVSSLFGLLVFGLLIWAFNFISVVTEIGIFGSIGIFLLSNIGIFFLIFLFFSYTSYFSKVYHHIYLPFSPIIIAVGVCIGFWIAGEALFIVNMSVASSVLAKISLYLLISIPYIFWFVVVLGYAIVTLRIATEKPVKRREKSAIAEPSKVATTRKLPKASETKDIRRLYRSGNDRVLGGVCGGIGEYLGVDPVIIRMLWILGSLAWGSGIILYIIAWLIIPRNPLHRWK